MQAEFTGRQVTITPALRRMGDEGIERIARCCRRAVGAHIVLTSEKGRKTADVAVKMRAGKIVGFAESNNMETALREALDRAETQAIRNRKRQTRSSASPRKRSYRVKSCRCGPAEPAGPARNARNPKAGISSEVKRPAGVEGPWCP